MIFIDDTKRDNFYTLMKSIDDYKSDIVRHSIAVAEVSKKLGEFRKFSDFELECTYLGALLHDCGKLRVGLDILEKSKLTDMEFAIYKNHTTAGVTLAMDISDNIDVLSIVGLHHVNYDNYGYRALNTEVELQMSELVKVVHIADILCKKVDIGYKEEELLKLIDTISDYKIDSKICRYLTNNLESFIKLAKVNKTLADIKLN